ncbi:hypothetical protein [Enterovibrio paralichthyis]|uniref:hypothetical protein n=1 Tax=Enterovibrio paralichthyis TaxID=2853805 RepID=UPI001C45A71D|nr:hypothetical protein [Enterovibrio paralichthyis]MBV7298628.1 hypothetical protein [Enterovibrio paralichthyis]
MIIGFSHLIVNSSDVEKDSAHIIEQGYHCSFSEVGLENNASKKQLLTEYSREHDIHLYRVADGYDIELINHHSQCNVVQDRIFYKDKILNIVMPDGSVAEELQFWEQLGFKTTESSAFLKRPVPSWNVEMCFTEVPDKLVEQKLDISGVTSIAFIVKKIENFVLKLENIAPWVSELFKLTVDGNELSIVLFKTPSGIIVELIEV